MKNTLMYLLGNSKALATNQNFTRKISYLRMLSQQCAAINNSRNNKNAQNSPNEDPQESNDFNYPKNFSNDHKKEYKASTLDWLGGQARI